MFDGSGADLRLGPPLNLEGRRQTNKVRRRTCVGKNSVQSVFLSLPGGSNFFFNRHCLRLETPATPSKQRIGPLSNRHRIAISKIHPWYQSPDSFTLALRVSPFDSRISHAKVGFLSASRKTR